MSYRYAQVEAVLAKLHDVDEAGMGAFRGAIIHLQRLGVVPSSPGRGKKIVYSLENTAVWAICFELSEFGFDPKAIASYMAGLGWSILREFSDIDVNAEDRFFVFWPTELGNRVCESLRKAGIMKFGAIRHNFVSASKLSDIYALDGLDLRARRRVGIVNLSALKRELITALAEQEREANPRELKEGTA